MRGTSSTKEGTSPAPYTYRTRPQSQQGSLPDQRLKITNKRNGIIKDGRRIYHQAECVKWTAAELSTNKAGRSLVAPSVTAKCTEKTKMNDSELYAQKHSLVSM